MSNIVLLEESLTAIMKLPDEDAGALVKALISGKSDGLPLMADLVYPIIKGQIDRMNEFRDKQRANGMKGGRPKTQKEPKENPDETQTKPRQNPDETQVKAPIPKPKPIKKEIPTVSRKKVFVPPTVDEVKEYVLEKGYQVDPDRFVDFYESKGWMVGKNKMIDWHAAVRTWAKDKKQTPPNRSDKVQQAYGFSTERQDVDYNKLAWASMWEEKT